MTSVVDTSVKYFDHTMLNSPALTRLAGSMVALLNALLVDGYDNKAATSVTVAGNTVTIAYAGGTHSAIVGSVITVTGSDEAALNGEQRVTAVDAASVKFQTSGVAAGVKTGATSFKMAPLGWSKPFTGTNQAVYKSTAVGANGHFLRIVDTGVSLVRAYGYENMTAVGTGTGLFPTAAQSASLGNPGGLAWHKSMDPGDGTSPGTAWMLCGDARMFYIGVAPYQWYNPRANGMWVRCFGDPIALRPAGDVFCTVLNGYPDTSLDPNYQGPGAIGNPVALSCYHPRAYTGLAGAVANYASPYEGRDNYGSGRDPWHGDFPSRIDGAMRLSPMRLLNAPFGDTPRADLPGIYWMPQANASMSFNTGDRFTGTGFLAGKKVTAVRTNHDGAASTDTSNPATTGVLFFDTTGPWR